MIVGVSVDGSVCVTQQTCVTRGVNPSTVLEAVDHARKSAAHVIEETKCNATQLPSGISS